MNSKNKIKISALIVARNEEINIKACLESLETADEIILLLDRSSDNTINIAKGLNCIIIEGSWLSEGIRRNEGIKQCSHDWILEIDADGSGAADMQLELENVEIANLDLDDFITVGS